MLVTFETIDGLKEHIDLWEIQSISERSAEEGQIIHIVTFRGGKSFCIKMDSTKAAELVNRLRKANPLVPQQVKKVTRAQLLVEVTRYGQQMKRCLN